jgi:hypothetical protein
VGYPIGRLNSFNSFDLVYTITDAGHAIEPLVIYI